MTIDTIKPEQSQLGKKSSYIASYEPSLLMPIARKNNRDALGIANEVLPFHGFDIWNHYEVSWLNQKGKPIVAIAEIIYGCDSLNIIESKSMKLYFNSFNNTQFKDVAEVQAIAQNDIAARLEGGNVSIKITPIAQFKQQTLYAQLDGISIDELDVDCSDYTINSAFLTTEDATVTEVLQTDLLKSNCLVTNQPDWCSVQISYQGNKINREGLLRYIVSFRNCNEFHEQSIERIFLDIMRKCKPTELTILGRCTRRGGIDINSVRSTKKLAYGDVSNNRLCRQ